MEFSFEGIGQVVATFAASDNVQPGMAVVLTGDSTVGLGEDGALPCGMALSVSNGLAAVQLSGVGKVGYSGTAPTVGWGGIAADGTGKVKASASGGPCLIISVNTDDKTAVIKL